MKHIIQKKDYKFVIEGAPKDQTQVAMIDNQGQLIGKEYYELENDADWEALVQHLKDNF